MRDFDMVFRYGGEEIMVLLPYTKLQGAEVLGNRLRQWVSERVLIEELHNGLPVNIKVTISVGVSTFDPTLENEGEMVARADMALYRAKKNGRDRVEVANPAEASMVDSGEGLMC